eukprot:1354722-Rhodomonas_salina.1
MESSRVGKWLDAVGASEFRVHHSSEQEHRSMEFPVQHEERAHSHREEAGSEEDSADADCDLSCQLSKIVGPIMGPGRSGYTEPVTSGHKHTNEYRERTDEYRKHTDEHEANPPISDNEHTDTCDVSCVIAKIGKIVSKEWKRSSKKTPEHFWIHESADLDARSVSIQESPSGHIDGILIPHGAHLHATSSGWRIHLPRQPAPEHKDDEERTRTPASRITINRDGAWYYAPHWPSRQHADWRRSEGVVKLPPPVKPVHSIVDVYAPHADPCAPLIPALLPTP